MGTQNYGFPDFARVEIRLSGKTKLRKAADQLRFLADQLDILGKGGMADPTACYLAWGSIKNVSQELRAK